MFISRLINIYRLGVIIKLCRGGLERGVFNRDWDEGINIGERVDGNCG